MKLCATVLSLLVLVAAFYSPALSAPSKSILPEATSTAMVWAVLTSLTGAYLMVAPRDWTKGRQEDFQVAVKCRIW